MDIAADAQKGENLRMNAIRSYLYRADAQETKDALVRFLVGDMKAFSLTPSIYECALNTYDEAEKDPLKREAIVASLAVALAREESRANFMSVDKNFAVRNKEYAESSQRLAILQRMNRLPPSKSYGDGGNLDSVIKPLQSRTTFTSVSTNLTELMARDFRKPKEKGEN
jgi:hypothetical protein